MAYHDKPELFEIHIRRMSDGLERVERKVGWVQEPGEDPRWPEFIWTEGNYSCDCNRALFFARLAGEPEPETPCTDGAFRIKVVELASGRVIFSELSPEPE